MNKTVEYYMSLPYRIEVVEDKDEGGFLLHCPEPTQELEYSGQFKLRLPKSLHKRLAQKSREEGVSMNQYCVYLLSKNA